jgi:hypothetical protein
MVEVFGSAQLNRAFIAMNLVVLPFWVAMIVAPSNRWVWRMAHPFMVPAVFSLVYVYAVYLLVTVTGVPPLAGLEMKAMRSFINHPLVFLVVWAHYLAVDLFLGMSIYRDAAARKIRVPVELCLCWIFGPIGLLAYVGRLAWLKLTFR